MSFISFKIAVGIKFVACLFLEIKEKKHSTKINLLIFVFIKY